VGIRADDAVAGTDDALFRQQRVFDTDTADVIIMQDVVFICEIAHQTALLRRLDILVRRKMIHRQRDAAAVKHMIRPGAFKFIDRNGSGDVVSVNDIKLCLDQLAGLYFTQTRVRSKDFLCHCHSHSDDPSFQAAAMRLAFPQTLPKPI